MNEAREENVLSDIDRYEMETVFVGPPSEVYVVQSVLHNLGFLTHIANENIKMLDPFVTGMNPLEARLQVPRSDAARAFQALREVKGDNLDGTQLVESTGDYDRELLESLDDLSRRIRWATLYVFLFPVAAVLGLIYVMRTLPLQTKPARHGVTMIAIVASWGLSLVAVASFFTWIRIGM